MKNSKILFLLIAGLLYGCQQAPEQKKLNKFTGLWSLHIMEEQNPETGEWSEWRNGMQGYILYDEQDNMSVHLTTAGYENTDLRFPNFVDSISIEALKHLTKSYVYFAKYSVDEEQGVVEHARISHSNPAEWNVTVRRKFTFSGDTLTLQPLEEDTAGLRLKWIKESVTSKSSQNE